MHLPYVSVPGYKLAYKKALSKAKLFRRAAQMTKHYA